MRAAITELVVCMDMTDIESPDGPMYTTVTIKVRDDGAGPYLSITGSDLSDGTETPDAFYLCSNAEIDTFAKHCKRVLKSAQTWREK